MCTSSAHPGTTPRSAGLLLPYIRKRTTAVPLPAQTWLQQLSSCPGRLTCFGFFSKTAPFLTHPQHTYVISLPQYRDSHAQVSRTAQCGAASSSSDRAHPPAMAAPGGGAAETELEVVRWEVETDEGWQPLSDAGNAAVAEKAKSGATKFTVVLRSCGWE